MNSGWYVVYVDVTLTECPTVTSDVNPILMDSCKLDAQGCINISGSDSLTIYAQSNGSNMGKLTAMGGDYQRALAVATVARAATSPLVAAGLATAPVVEIPAPFLYHRGGRQYLYYRVQLGFCQQVQLSMSRPSHKKVEKEE